MTSETMTNSLQENLLTLLAFDDENGPIIRNAVEDELFEGVYQDIASAIYQFLDKFDEAPKEHLPDLLDKQIEDSSNPKSTLYTKIIANIIQLNESGVNTTYTMSRLNDFLRAQRLKQGVLEAAEIIQDNTSESLDKAEHVLTKSMNSSLDLFDPGVKLSDPEFLSFATEEEQEAFPVGIEELDMYNLGPRRQELWMLLGGTKSGKSWALVNLAKQSLLQRQKVLYLTLEMSESVTAQRISQALFSFSKRPETFQHTKFEVDGLKRIIGFDYETVEDRPSMQDSDFTKWINSKMSQWGSRLGDNLMIKNFPSGQLTVNGLKSYLDSLERTEGFVPDLILLDYADLLHINPQNYRLELGTAIKDLRGIAVERNVAMATVTQSNREGVKSRNLDETNMSEDFSKAFTVDTLIGLSRTEAESELNLGRLNVILSRNEEAGFSIMISQNYGLGLFCVDSAFMTSGYWDVLKQESTADVTIEAE